MLDNIYCHVRDNVPVAHKLMEMQKALAPTYMKVHKYAQKQTRKCSHLQLLHSVHFNIYNHMHTDT